MSDYHKEYGMLTDTDIERLKEYAELEGAETGEKIQVLLSALMNYAVYMMPKTSKAIVDELLKDLKWFDENVKIITIERTIIESHRELDYI